MKRNLGPISQGLALFLSTILTGACAIRVGAREQGDAGPTAPGGADAKVGSTGDPPPGSTAAPVAIDSACQRIGSSSKLPTAAGANSFAWLWDVDHYVLAYADPNVGNGDIFTVFLRGDGSPLAPPQAVEFTVATSALPSIAKTPAGYLVAWQEGTAGKAVYAHAIDRNGAPVGRGITVAATDSDQVRPVLATTQGGTVVAYMDNVFGTSAAQVAFVDANLTVSGPKRIARDSGGAGWPWIAGDELGVGIIWSDRRTMRFDLRFANLDVSNLAFENDSPVRTGPQNDAILGRMIKTGTGYFAAWEDTRGDGNQIFMAVMNATGTVMSTGLVEEPNSGDANWPNLAWTGAFGAVVYYQWRDAEPQVFISFVDGTGHRIGGDHDLPVSDNPSGAAAKYPDVVWTGAEFGVAWVDTRGGAPGLYFARVICKP